MLVGLLRHGEVEGGSRFRGHTDDPLTPAGLAQMYAALADNSHWDRIISSPLARCAEFAGRYTAQHGLPLTFDGRLKEMNFGAWEGRTAAELMARDRDALTRFWSDPEKNPPPGGERLVQFQARVLAAWNDIVTDQTGQKILVVTHGGVIRVLLSHALQRPLGDLLELNVGPASLHCIRIAGTQKRIPAMGVSGSRPA